MQSLQKQKFKRNTNKYNQELNKMNILILTIQRKFNILENYWDRKK